MVMEVKINVEGLGCIIKPEINLTTFQLRQEIASIARSETELDHVKDDTFNISRTF